MNCKFKQYIPRYFKIQELVPPKVYKDRGIKAFHLLDDRLLYTLDELRDDFGPMTINNWTFGGNRQWSGLRTSDAPMYSKYSQHSYGRAADILFSESSVNDVRAEIMKNNKYCYIRALELNTSWLHIDVRNCDKLFTFNP